MQTSAETTQVMFNSQLLQATLIETAEILGLPNRTNFSEAERRIGLLASREASLADCLIVTIFGGTKVGKTTLINALAGREIGKASAKACFTNRPAVYVHISRAAQAHARLAGVLKTEDLVIVHEEKALERIILIDTPDLDGIEISHHEIFHQVLERSDLALCVVTTQKYDSLDLFQVLGNRMGFRRAVFLFNRADEGIPVTPKIREDLRQKIAPFSLLAPDGTPPPILGISALNALIKKQASTAEGATRCSPAGPCGEFGKLEELLLQKLDEVMVKRISQENMLAMLTETRTYILDVGGIPAAKTWINGYDSWQTDFLQKCTQNLQKQLDPLLERMGPEVAHRREQAAAAKIGGPFGAYLRTRLAIAALPLQFQLIAGAMGDPAESLSQRLMREMATVLDEYTLQFKRGVIERCEQENLSAEKLMKLLGKPKDLSLVSRDHLVKHLRAHLQEPSPGGGEIFLLNLMPSALLLLLVYYFIHALLAASEPGAGVFLGGALLFWLICHLQASFWLPRKAGSITQAGEAITGEFANQVQQQTTFAVQPWVSQVRNLVEKHFPQDNVGE